MRSEIICGLLLSMQFGQAKLSPCLFLNNLKLNGGTTDEFPANSAMDCCVRCDDIPCCVAYTFVSKEKRCYLKSSIEYSTEEQDHISGLRPNAYSGKGVRMKNVKISGDKGTRVNLSDREDCQEYCTVFKVFSWQPPVRSPGQDNAVSSGECSCMTRIKEVKYSFGCYSAIMPHQ